MIIAASLFSGYLEAQQRLGGGGRRNGSSRVVRCAGRRRSPGAAKPVLRMRRALANLQMEIARRLRLVQHALDPDAPGAMRRSPVDCIALAITQDGGADA